MRPFFRPFARTRPAAAPTSHLSEQNPGKADDEFDQFTNGFSEFLASERIVDVSAIERARRAANSTRERFDHVLTKLGLMSDPDLASALSRYLDIPLASAADLPQEPLLTDVITGDFAKRNLIIPLLLTDDALVLGVLDPFRTDPINALAYMMGRSIRLRLFTASAFEKAFQAIYVDDTKVANDDQLNINMDANDTDIQRLRDIASEAPTIRLVNMIIANAVDQNASDIHVEPTLESVLVRYRIDGLLRISQSLSPGTRAAIISRIKIMAKLDIAERRMPQDGRIKLAIRGIDIDFRISTIPTAFGESVVMRILDRSRVELDFGKLGFSSKQITTLEGLMAQPNGIVLVTGPTGSGKTTTLYTALKGLNRPERKVFTVEDPIEYQLNGINQVQVQPAIGLTFPHALRSILRQDPDIVMIGEIRDLETARIAVQASLTGHLVFSTLHTNSAAATIARLIDMGVENYLLASTIKGILAQRLVRDLCKHCARPHPDAAHWEQHIRQRLPDIEATPSVREAVGCEHCGETGFAGRSTIAETLVMSSALHKLILASASETSIEGAARQEAMTTMYEDGLHKVWIGTTTIDEVLRATRED